MNDATKPVHAPMIQFPVVDNCLTVGGIPVTRLAARIGQTPIAVNECVTQTPVAARQVSVLGVSLEVTN